MPDRQYQWIIFMASVGSAVLLTLAFARYSDLAAARAGILSSLGFVWAIIPGALCAALWMLQRRAWLRHVGLIATLGVLAYSVYRYVTALGTKRLGGDMWFLIELDGVTAILVTLGWTIFALLLGWANSRAGSSNPADEHS